MNQDSLSFTLTQISYLVSNLNKKNFTQNTKQISLVSPLFHSYFRCRHVLVYVISDPSRTVRAGSNVCFYAQPMPMMMMTGWTFFNKNFSQWSVVCHCVSACRHFGKIDHIFIFRFVIPRILELRLIGKIIITLTGANCCVLDLCNILCA